MNRLVSRLKDEIEHKQKMLHATAPTSWFGSNKYTEEKQKLWEEKEKLEIKELKDAIKCLETNGF